MRLFLLCLSMHLKSRMAYKKSFFFSIVGQFLTSFMALLGMVFLLDRFETVGDYTLSECLLCAGVTLSSYSLAECFFRGFDRFSSMIRGAEFDRVLLRPRSAMALVLFSDFELTRVGRLIQGVAMLIWGATSARLHWTAWRAAVLLMMVAGGTAVFAGLFILYAGLCFFTLEGLEVVNIFTDGAREFGVYPLDVFGERMLKITTFLIPYALFQYYPLMYVLGRRDNPWLGLMPLLSFWFLLPCVALWRLGVRKYQSAGS